MEDLWKLCVIIDSYHLVQRHYAVKYQIIKDAILLFPIYCCALPSVLQRMRLPVSLSGP